ncbi:hypothetical protein N0V93_002604 [Gnomoniopsis smithogilvyi]|uniref:Uncharacterized protein n=1 Tax=Gnomoniopsis smithogilvyi TaxID=1191159 RepID=A0A9W8YV40_9PEZI|nr:hypothetical protein N0V93_002604 [Gnomoniopsis smithogilvyi]
MSLPPVCSSEENPDERAGLFDLDNDDLIAEIIDGHSYLLDQQDDMEQMAPYNAAIPQSANRAPVIYSGPPAAKPVAHSPSAQHGQNADSPLPLTSIRQPESPHVKSSSDYHPSSGHHKRPRQDAPSGQDVQKTSRHQPRQRYQSHRTSDALYDPGLSHQGFREASHKHNDGLSQKLSDLSLYDCQQTVNESYRRHRSSFVENYQPSRHAEPSGDPSSRRRGLSQHADFTDVPSDSRNTHQPEVTTATDFDSYIDHSSSSEWEDEADEHEYEEVTVDRTKTTFNGNEAQISTNQDLKYTSLILAESSAKMMYLCGRKMYEVMWTSQTSQRLRRSAMHTTRCASGSAANSLGRLAMDTCKGSLGGVKHYVSRRWPVFKAVRRPPRDMVRLCMARALRMSRTKLAGRALPTLGLLNAEIESDIEDNYDFCDDVEGVQPSNASLSSPDNHGDEALGLAGFHEDDMDEDEL